MNLEEAIKIAIENGYEPKDIFGVKYIPFTLSNKINEMYVQYVHLGLLDPLFWQALRKGLEWDNPKIHKASFCPVCDSHIPETIEVYKYHWHRLIDHLDEGKDIESFFANLTDNK